MRNTNINFNTKGKTDVKIEKVINFEAAGNGSHDADDQDWNAFKFYGNTDKEESSWRGSGEMSATARKRVDRFVGRRVKEILDIAA